MPVPTTDSLNTHTTPASEHAHAYTRQEVILGLVHGVALAPHQHGQQFIRVTFELNVLDGWVRSREWTDDSGVVWTGESTRKSHVGAVLDAAPEHAAFIACAHLAWLTAMKLAGESRRARQQRRALDKALRRHGLAVRDRSTAAKPARRPDSSGKHKPASAP